MTAPPPVGIRTGARYRVVDEARIVEMLVLLGWAIDARLGRLEAARRDAAETLERWIGMGLACKRSADGARRFDPAELYVHRRHYLRRSGRDGLRRVDARGL